MKKYFIIGGTSGIGYEILMHTIKSKNKVCFTYYQNSKLAKQITNSNLNVKAFRLNLKSEKNIYSTLKNSKKFLKSFDVVILCSLKYLKRNSFAKIKIKDFEDFYSYNFFGYIKILKHLLKFQKKNIKILNLSSYVLKSHSAGLTFYNSYKSAIEELFLTLSNEYKDVEFKNIRLGKYNTNGYKKTNSSYLNNKLYGLKSPMIAAKRVIKNF